MHQMFLLSQLNQPGTHVIGVKANQGEEQDRQNVILEPPGAFFSNMGTVHYIKESNHWGSRTTEAGVDDMIRHSHRELRPWVSQRVHE